MVGNTSCSLDKECTDLCEDEIRINGMKSYNQSKNREGNTKVNRILYHLQHKDYVKMMGIKKCY